jgi:hypothetical protein
MADGFKKGLKEYYPEAQLVGEDYHKLFLTDFARISRRSRPRRRGDLDGRLDARFGQPSQAGQQMGIMLPFANLYMTSPTN